MLKNKIISLMIVFVTVGFFAFADEDSLSTDTFFTRNIQLNSIIYTNQGMILLYHTGRKMVEAYLPNRFFETGKIKIVPTDEHGTSHQANIVYRNGKPFKVKIYTNRKAQGPGYVVKDNITKATKEKFDKTEDLDFPL